MPTAIDYPLEFTSYIASDGSVYRFNNGVDRWVWGFQGGGLAPVQYITQQGPFQHGQTVIDYRFQPRLFTLIHRRNGNCRADYWAHRRQILTQLTPSRQLFGEFTTGTLRKKISPTLSVDLKVLVSEGLNFDQRQNAWDEWAIQDAIRFIAHDPFYYGTSTHEIEFGGTGDDELVFPITFPIVFGKSFVDDTQVINYAGTFNAFPIITITGPAKGVTLTNLATNEMISLNYDVPTGVIVTINLSEGQKTASDNLGNNLIGYITPNSDLATFSILPHPGAPNGVNTIRMTAANTQPGETRVVLSYQDKYVGV